jgi:hypothetical protein
MVERERMLGAVEIWNGREGATASSLLPSVLDPKGLEMDLWSVFVLRTKKGR